MAAQQEQTAITTVEALQKLLGASWEALGGQAVSVTVNSPGQVARGVAPAHASTLHHLIQSVRTCDHHLVKGHQLGCAMGVVAEGEAAGIRAWALSIPRS